MQLKCLLLNGGAIQRSFHRHYVSFVNLNINSFKSLRVTSKDSSDSSAEVKLTFLDSETKKEVDSGKVDSLELHVTEDTFDLKCSKPNDGLSAILELPMTVPDVKIDVNISGKSSVLIENLQANSVKVGLKTGDIGLKHVKCGLMVTEVDLGNITTNNTVLAQNIRLISRNGNVTIGKCIGDRIEVEAEKIKIGSCYSKVGKFTSTVEADLKNIHGDTSIKAKGRKLKCLGFAGTIQAELDIDEVDIQISDTVGDSKISSVKAGAQIKLSFSDDVLIKTNFKISSDCNIDSYINQLMVYQNSKSKLFRIDRNDPRCDHNRLTVNVRKGKSLELNTLSWIDFFKR